MRSPWKRLAPMDPDAEYLVLASSIPARRYSSTPRLFKGANATMRQLRDSEGLVGFSLLARPATKRYATLSVWRDEAALQSFARAQPHGDLMRALAPEMGETKFLRWSIRGSDGRPSWRDALRRLAAAPIG